MRSWRSSWTALAAAAITAGLAGCADAPPAPPPAPTPISTASLPPSTFRQCVPYARALSGIELYGDAWTWWDGAVGRFDRGAAPVPGAVLVLARTDRLRHGHLAVVQDQLGPREIRVAHANWGGTEAERARPVEGQRVLDISPRNDWRVVRFWNLAASEWGRPYPSYGFVYPTPARTAARVSTAAP